MSKAFKINTLKKIRKPKKATTNYLSSSQKILSLMQTHNNFFFDNISDVCLKHKFPSSL